jgi:hypothetical protein
MKRRLFIFFSLVMALGFGLQSIAQFTPEEIAETAKWEEFLQTAEITGQEQMVGRESVTSPWHLTLKKDDVVRDAIWKNPEGRMRGFIEGWKWEIAAYRLDKHLELNMVPPTVERRFQGSRGSCQLWVEYEMSLKRKEENKVKTPSYKVFPWNRAIYLQRAFDNLIANQDRHQNQILITKDWRMILIDHSRSFSSQPKFAKSLIYTAKHKEGPKLMRELPRAFVEKLKALNFELIKNIVGEYLTDEEINAVLARRDLMLQEIDKLIKEFGEENVLY